MSLFLSDAERAGIMGRTRHPQTVAFYWALSRRVETRAAKPGLVGPTETADWWRPVSEYLTDAAMAHALKPSQTTAIWLRDATLSVVRRPVSDWVGPHYRDHTPCADGTSMGHLETAHFCWATALVLDLAQDVFSSSERDEMVGVLQDRGSVMCLNWLNRKHSIANWWCVMTAGLTVTAAVLNDAKLLDRAQQELRECSQIFQPDGSYGESLQYGNYALYALMLSCEALRRRGINLDDIAPIGRFMGYARWAVASYLYSRSTSGWGSAPKPRSLNFNDSGAVFKPTADVLLYLATHGNPTHPTEAGLARWLFDQTYTQHPAQGPHDQASFGLRPDWGFLTLNFLSQAASPISPAEAGLDSVQAFECGDLIARDHWDGKTVLAMRGGGAPLHAAGHLHQDLNSIILVHNQQRLLTDAGHSCYRNTLRKLEIATETHNTCTFYDEFGNLIEQHDTPHRTYECAKPDLPVLRRATRLIAGSCGQVRVVGTDAAHAYGQPIQRFARFAILCGSHAIFVVDHIISSRPVRAQWTWLLNNRDGDLDLKVVDKDRMVIRRGDAGMKLFSLVKGTVSQKWAHVNDAYHCLPGQMGEGRSGSGILLQWTESTAMIERIAIHAMAVDAYGAVANWHLQTPGESVAWESPNGQAYWVCEAKPDRILISEQHRAESYRLGTNASENWSLQRI